MDRGRQAREQREARRRLVGYLAFAFAAGFLVTFLIFIE